jgi:hypothetical protein
MKNSKHSWSTELTPRAVELLILVADNTKGQRYFVPRDRLMWSDTLRRYVDVDGSGVASSFRALARRGFIEATPDAPRSYCYVATKDGHCAAAMFAQMPAYGGK